MTAATPSPGTTPRDASAPFAPRTILFIVVAGILAFLLLLVLAAFAPDFRSGRDGRAHALSVSGDGYAGLVELTDATGSHSLIVRNPANLSTSALLIVTPEVGGDPAALDRIMMQREGHPTLIVLPKWRTKPAPGNRSWRLATGLLPAPLVADTLGRIAPDARIFQTPFAPKPPSTAFPGVPRLARAQIGSKAEQQRIGGKGLIPLLVDAQGRIVLAQAHRKWPGNGPILILAEPDLLNNQGLADRWTAQQGWRIIDDLATDNEIAFDMTLEGFTPTKSPLRLMLAPPFLPVTLCILAAGLLAGLHGAFRFGAPAPPERAIAPGKRALVDNAAMLFRAARKEHRVGATYAALTRDLAAQGASAPAQLRDEALALYLDRAAPDAGDLPFATLAWHAEIAEDRTELLGAARALYRWRRNRTR